MTAKANDRANLLISNVQITYARMLVTMFLGLLTTRIVYGALGEVGYGLFAVLGSSVFFITTIESTLKQSTERHIAFEIGKGELDQASRVFSTSFALTTTISILVLLAGWFSAEKIVSLLTIPAGSANAASVTLRMTIASTAVLIFSSPFVAVLAANQNFFFPAVLALLFSLCSFLAALSLNYLSGDPLVNYSILRCGLLTASAITTTIYCLKKYSVARFNHTNVNSSLLKPLVSYGGWSGLGAFGWNLRIQGIQLIGNKFIGPTFNSALGIALAVNGYASTLPSTVIRVARPMMTQMFGRDDSKQALLLRDSVTRICPILAMLVIGPLVIELPFALKQWLGVPPTLAVGFTLIILCNLILDHATAGYGIVFSATGNIRGYAVFTFLNVLVQLVVAYALAYGFSSVVTSTPPIILMVVVLGTFANLLYRIIYAGFDQPVAAMNHWFLGSALRITLVILLPIVISYGIVIYVPSGILRLAIVTGVHSVLLIGFAWLFGFQQFEKKVMLAYGSSASNKIRSRVWNWNKQ